MKKFYYQSINQKGMQAEGWIHASSKSDAANQLNAKGITPYSIRLTENCESISDLAYKIFPKLGIKYVDLILLFGQLKSLSAAGVSILTALQSSYYSAESKRLKKILQDIISSVEHGHSLSEALNTYSGIFSPFVVSIVSMGEKTGNLDYSFHQIKTYYEEDMKSRRQLKSAMRYPIMVVSCLILAIGIINFMVVPVFIDFFKSFSAELPIPTKILISTSEFFLAHGDILLSMFVLCWICGWIYKRTNSGQYYLGEIKLSIPFIGKIIKFNLVAQFCLHLAHALQANIQILKALQVISELSDNIYFKTKINSIRESIELGDSFSTAMAKSEFFSPVLLQIVKVGESTGNLENALIEISNFYFEEASYHLKTLSEKIEPLLILFISLMVLILALGVFLPMWDISTVALKDIYR